MYNVTCLLNTMELILEYNSNNNQSGEKSRPGFQATFCALCLVRIQVFRFFCKSKISFKCFSWKSTRCVVFHKQSNDKRIKVNEDQDLFCGVSEKSGFKWLHKESFESFLELLGRERSASINCFFYKSLILLSL